MSSLVEISEAFLTKLSGLSVTQAGSSIPVTVIAGIPQEDFLTKNFPAITVNLLEAQPDYNRADDQVDTFTDGTSAWAKYLPEPWNLSYQVEVFSRYTIHQDIIVETIMSRFSRNRGAGLIVSPTTLAADAVEGDNRVQLTDASLFSFGQILVLDGSTPYARSGKQQAFFVVRVESDGWVTLDPPLNQNFLAGSATCYKAQYEVVFERPLQMDVGQDGARSYQRRIQLYTVWANLDLAEAEEVKAVETVQLNWVPTRPSVLGKQSWTAF